MDRDLHRKMGASDLVQETLLKAMRYESKFEEGTNLKGWLFTIMKNIFINNYRKKVKANTIMDSTDNLYYINSGKSMIANGAESNIMMKEIKRGTGPRPEAFNKFAPSTATIIPRFVQLKNATN